MYLDVFREESDTLDVYGGYRGYLNLHDMTVRSVISVITRSRTVATPREKQESKISYSINDIIVFVYIAPIVSFD
jgi:hypothetical protein